MRSTLIRGGQLLQQHEGRWRLEPCDLWIRAGRVERLGSSAGEAAVDATEVIEAEGFVVMPGLINAHYHSHDNLVRGLGPEQPLELWSLAYSPSREGYTPKEAYASTLLGCAELLASGCTAVIDHVKLSPHLDGALLDAVAQAYLDAGMRACIVPVVADRPVAQTLPLTAEEQGACSSAGPSTSYSASEQVRRVAAFHTRWQGRDDRIRVGIGPSGPQRCSDELLRTSADWARSCGVPLHTHVLETRLQRATAQRLYGRPMVEHLARLGFLAPNTHLVHMVWASDAELDLVAADGALVVHNPVSNVRLGSGTAPVPRMLSRGIPVALGVDSACCHDGNDLFECMKWATLIHNLAQPDPHHWLRPDDALTFATLGGAAALGGEPGAGTLSVGNAADLVLVDLSAPGLVPLNAPIRQLVLAAGSRAVAMTMVAGEVVYEGGRPLRFDLPELHRELRAMAGPRVEAFAARPGDAAMERLIRGAYRRVTQPHLEERADES